jgi:hypothetical protein
MAGCARIVAGWSGSGVQVSALSYPHLSHEEIFEAVAEFYRRFYFRPRKLWEMTSEMFSSADMVQAPLSRGRRVLPVPAVARKSRRSRRGSVICLSFNWRIGALR